MSRRSMLLVTALTIIVMQEAAPPPSVMRCTDAQGRITYSPGMTPPAGRTCEAPGAAIGPRGARPLQTEPEQAQAIKSCQGLVRVSLTTPTARFASGHYVGSEAEVIGEVDAQNRQGALVRSPYACRMRGTLAESAQVYAR
jgi:hypothetical protein